jgi:hypothetical protein
VSAERLRTEIPAEASAVALLWRGLPDQGATMGAVEGPEAISLHRMGKAAAEGAKLPPPATGSGKKRFKASD